MWIIPQYSCLKSSYFLPWEELDGRHCASLECVIVDLPSPLTHGLGCQWPHGCLYCVDSACSNEFEYEFELKDCEENEHEGAPKLACSRQSGLCQPVQQIPFQQTMPSISRVPSSVPDSGEPAVKGTGKDAAFLWRWHPSERDNKKRGTHTAVKAISEKDNTVPMMIKRCHGGEGPRNRAKISKEISLDPRLEWGEAMANSRESIFLADGTATAKVPWQGQAWRGKGLEPKLVGFDHELGTERKEMEEGGRGRALTGSGATVLRRIAKPPCLEGLRTQWRNLTAVMISDRRREGRSGAER